MKTYIETLSLKGARVEKGYTQEQIADKLGVSKRSYIDWEKGNVVPKHMVVYALAYIYGMDADFLRLPKKF
ncbi:helix-turn-helix transcriptional regulator [Staphylococcus gallinarum]|uniref:helix-turn-helix transcriptional regulator n=1 Tax=Staphylococcus gallinarum TaxID=1293 RepID=UPI000D1E1240|nr:helix-turn-helix transcriptional regulator [Staphylococcus gallinarum]PTK92522.1 transcriptional regulator [Staphylococcus gallinarum]PTK93449.1 transcriptional regulator [Staphylococcus gallinarum]RIO87112.1 XRE family transcriptional regulator [Staphylococcus gallinarum]